MDEDAKWKEFEGRYLLIKKTKWYYMIGGFVAVLTAVFAVSWAGTRAGLHGNRAEAAIKRLEEHRDAAEQARSAIDDFALIQEFALTAPATLGDRTVYVRASHGTHPGMVRVRWRPVREAVAYEFWRTPVDRVERRDYQQVSADSFKGAMPYWDDKSEDALSGSNFHYVVQCYFLAGDGQRLPRELGRDIGFGGARKSN